MQEPDYNLFSNKVRLYPNQKQAKDLANNCGSRRWVYNHFLELQNQTWENYRKWEAAPRNRRSRKPPAKRLSLNECCRILTGLRNAESTKWLSESSAQMQQQALRDLDTAFSRFLSGTSKHPRFKKRGQHDGFRIPQWIDVDFDNHALRLGKLGWIRCRGLRPEIETRLTVQSITVSTVAGKWYASVLCRVPKVEPRKHTCNRACGIDVGVVVPYSLVSSTGLDAALGKKFSQDLSRKEERRKRYQRAMRRKLEAHRCNKKTNPDARLGSNFKKAAAKVAKAYQREAAFRLDYQHKLTTRIAKSYAVICVEDLRIRNMTKSAKGTIEKPGKNVHAKSGLNREMLRLAHSQFVSLLEYKARKFGCQIIPVDPRNTSRTCPKCEHIAKANRNSQAEFECVACGYTANADLNAAHNIMRRGLDILELAA